MLSLSVFGAGFLMRPVGAIVLGAYIDHHGRRKGLILTLGLMAVGTLAVAAVREGTQDYLVKGRVESVLLARAALRHRAQACGVPTRRGFDAAA